MQHCGEDKPSIVSAYAVQVPLRRLLFPVVPLRPKLHRFVHPSQGCLRWMRGRGPLNRGSIEGSQAGRPRTSTKGAETQRCWVVVPKAVGTTTRGHFHTTRHCLKGKLPLKFSRPPRPDGPATPPWSPYRTDHSPAHTMPRLFPLESHPPTRVLPWSGWS